MNPSIHHNFILDISNKRDEELVRLVQAQDESAFEELMSRYNPQIWGLVNVNSRQHRDAEEILMDIWFVVWENIIGLRRAESFGGWLRRIAITACKRYYSSRQHQVNEMLLNYEDLASQIDMDAEQRFHDDRILEDAREAVNQLPDKVKSVGVKYYLEQWSINDIAKELNLAAGTVKTKLSEVRQYLRKEFEVTVEPIRRETVPSKDEQFEITKSRIKVIGIGGAGCSVVQRMIETDVSGIAFYAIDTDKESLNSCGKAIQLQIGANSSQGLGTNGSLELGRQAAAENLEQLRSIVEDTELVFVIAGLGGGTGTAVAPIVASLAREHDALTICLATRPFHAEGNARDKIADVGLQEMLTSSSPSADAVIAIPNEQVLELINSELSLPDILLKSDEILIQGISVITNIVLETGEINVDLDDIKQVMRDQSTVKMSIGKATGENRATIAAQNAMSSPLLEGDRIADATNIIVIVNSPENFTMYELNEAMEVLVNKSSSQDCIFGLVYKDELEQSDEVLITVIACMPDSLKGQESSPSTETQKAATDKDRKGTSSDLRDIAEADKHNAYDLSELMNNDPSKVRGVIESGVSATVQNKEHSDARIET